MASHPGNGEPLPPNASLQHHTPIPQLPRPPSPAADQGISPSKGPLDEKQAMVPPPGEIDIYTLGPVAALKLLCRMIETLVEITGDIPPTPPVNVLGPPHLAVLQKEKQNIAKQEEGSDINERTKGLTLENSSAKSQDHDDVPPRAKTPIGSPESRPSEPLHIPDPKTEPFDIQHGVIVRKFYSKKAPIISLEEYLIRVHQYCPMTTGVYLATSLYIHRLAVVEHVIPVTARNAHRLVLAGLRVSMKKLEDHKYSHSRFAKVGGVSETELGRLEISFCFLTNFDLKADEEMLSAHAKAIGDGGLFNRPKSEFQPILPMGRDRRHVGLIASKVPTAKPKAPAAA